MENTKIKKQNNNNNSMIAKKRLRELNSNQINEFSN